MKAKVFFQMFILSAVLMIATAVHAVRNHDGQLIYNPIEENGVTVGQTVYKMDGGILGNYMKYSYKYDDRQRMTESEAQKWNADKKSWENDLRINYKYEGKSVTMSYYKWNKKKAEYVLVPEMTVTMDNTGM